MARPELARLDAHRRMYAVAMLYSGRDEEDTALNRGHGGRSCNERATMPGAGATTTRPQRGRGARAQRVRASSSDLSIWDSVACLGAHAHRHFAEHEGDDEARRGAGSSTAAR